MPFPIIPVAIAAANLISNQIASHQGTSNPLSPLLSLASMAYSGFQTYHKNPTNSSLSFGQYQNMVNDGESAIVSENAIKSSQDIYDYDTFMSLYGN